MRSSSEREALGESTSTLPSGRHKNQLDAPYDDFDAHPHAATSSTPAAIGSGNRVLATERSTLCNVPIELVGHATSPMAARSRSSSDCGCRLTIERPTASDRS